MFLKLSKKLGKLTKKRVTPSRREVNKINRFYKGYFPPTLYQTIKTPNISHPQSRIFPNKSLYSWRSNGIDRKRKGITKVHTQSTKEKPKDKIQDYKSSDISTERIKSTKNCKEFPTQPKSIYRDRRDKRNLMLSIVVKFSLQDTTSHRGTVFHILQHLCHPFQQPSKSTTTLGKTHMILINANRRSRLTNNRTAA